MNVRIDTTLSKNSLKGPQYSINLDNYYVPMDIPDKKLEQYIFTVKKMRKTLNF